MRRILSCSLRVLPALALFACTDIPQNPPPTTVVAQFDPTAATPIVPLPNDLIKDPVTHLLNVPKNPTASAAQQEFDDYLRSLDGFPQGTPITASFSDAVNPDTVSIATAGMPSGSVVVVDVTDKKILGPASFPKSLVTADHKGLSFGATPQLALGHTYAVAVFGNQDPNGVKAADGTTPVVAAPFTFFARSTTPLLSKCSDTTQAACLCPQDMKTGAYDTSCTPALGLSFGQAQQLEGIRTQYDPLLTQVFALAGGTRSRTDVILFWTFSIATGPFAVFDPTVGKVPLPNDVLLDQTTHKVNLPMMAALPESIRAGLNKLDGFSTTGDVTVNVDTVDGKAPQNLSPDDSVILFNVSGFAFQPSYTAAGQMANGGKDYTGILALTPTAPLLPDQDLYVVVITNKVTDTAKNPLRPSPVMQLVKSRSPLYCTAAQTMPQQDPDGGVSGPNPCLGLAPDKSTVPAELDDATAKQLEGLRVAFDNPTDDSLNLWKQLLKLKSVQRDEVAMVWAFHTLSLTDDLKKFGAFPTANNLPTSVTILDVQQAPGKLGGMPAPHVGQVVHGRMKTHLALGADGTVDLDPKGGKDVDLPFYMTIPTAPPMGAMKAPVAIVQHGLFSWRGDARYIAEQFAQQGWATVAIDIDYHGGRSICVADSQCQTGGKCAAGVCSTSLLVACESDGDCESGGTCNVKGGVCSGPLAKDSRLCMTYNGPGGQPTTECKPVASGAAFLSFTNVVAIRDNFRQHALDLAQLKRTLGGPELASALAAKNIAIEGGHVTYIGQSLGGIEGALYLAATAKDNMVGVLNVPGGKLPDILVTSPGFTYLVDPLLKGFGVSKDTAQYYQLLNIFRWVLDPADPINFGRALQGHPVIVQEAGSDMTIPNPYTDALAHEMNLPFVASHPAFSAGIGQPIVPTYFAGAAHGFIYEYPPTTGTVSGQNQAVGFLTSDGTNLPAP